MSDEIRTPINGIMGLIDMLIENTGAKPLWLEYLEKDIEILSEHADDIPEFLQVDNNRFNQVLSSLVFKAIKFCTDK